ncbi:MAG: flagellar basal-body MS-ring/collar protein FliF [Parvularculaceae bacterium]
MSSLVENWSRLSLAKQASALAAAVGVAIAIAVMANMASKPPMALLYAGLDYSSAGQVLETLEGMNVDYRVDGDAIYVAAPKRDSVRMALAREGLPNQGQAGFELLDGLSGFATTSDMFDTAYWRAKEGELARSILTIPGVRAARVHIASARRQAFSRTAATPSAVVTVTMASGRLSHSQAKGIRFLIALAIADLQPEHVAVIDSVNGVVLAPGETDDAAGYSLDKIAERERAMERDLMGLLEARVGAGNARVKVAIDVSNESETYSERVLDPQQRILVNRETSEKQEQGSSSARPVTVASNLPEGDGAAGGGESSTRSETTETTRYDVSERRRERVIPAGALERIHVAVLVNDMVQDGEAAPRPKEELQTLENLITAAIGYDRERGDVVTIESMAFSTYEPAGEEVVKQGVADFLRAHLMQILQLVIPALVSLILALFVLKPILTSTAPAKQAPALAPGPANPQLAAPQAAAVAPPETPEDQLTRVVTQKMDASRAVLSDWASETGGAA